jgi:RNA polymerase sigma-70 factor (ECF subfamily)
VVSDDQNSRSGEKADDPDLPLVRRIADGDAAAFAMLVDRHLDRVVRLAERLMSSRADAEDVAQEVFVRVWRHAQNWKSGNARYSTWLHRVAVNLCQDRLRKRREVDLEAVAEMPTDEPGAEQLMNRKTVARRISEALSKLPERQRIAITLCHFEGMGNKEAAEVMDVSVEALESLLARGRRALKAMLVSEKAHLMGEER